MNTWEQIPGFDDDVDLEPPCRADDRSSARSRYIEGLRQRALARENGSYVEVEAQVQTIFAPEAPAFRLYDDVEAMNQPPTEWIIDGILERKSKAALVGQSGVYKTTILADMLVAVATGQDWFGHRVLHRGNSVYVPAESGGFHIRLAAAKRARHLSLTVPIGVYTFPAAIDLRDRSSVDRFVTFILEQNRNPVIVAIDTYAAATPGSAENSSEDTTLAMAMAGIIKRALEATVILVHHTNAAGTRERGHSSMKGDLDTMLMMEEVEPDIEVRCEKQRNAAKFDPFKLRPVPDTVGSVVLRPSSQVLASDTLTQKQLAVLDVLREAGRDGVTKVQWKDLAKNIATERSFYKITDRLEAQGYLVRSGNYFRVKVTS